MRLNEYIDINKISPYALASALGISYKHLYHLRKGNDMKLSLAKKIQQITFGAVRYRDLEPTIESSDDELVNESKHLPNVDGPSHIPDKGWPDKNGGCP
jgi:hypothetical protein